MDDEDLCIEYPFEETGGSGDENRIRGNWSNKLDCFLSLSGLTFAFGNLWRFPYQFSIHGGLSYLVPYICLFLVGAMPIMFIELSVGQFVSLGPIGVWKMSPFFKGIGLSMVFISSLMSIYYNLVTSWALYYMVNSLKFTLPWMSCNNAWNTENCSIWNIGAVEACQKMSGTIFPNGTCINYGESLELVNTTFSPPDSTNSVKPSMEYFHNQVLMISNGIDDFHTINWQLAICLLIAWLFVFLCSFKGIKTSGKVVYITAVFPYVILVALLIRFITLPGSLDGLSHFLHPRWDVLYDLRTWGDAAIQVFYSLCTCTGGLITISSYNRFHNNIFYDIWIISTVVFVTSLLVSALIFSAIGFVCHDMQIGLEGFQLHAGLQVIFVFFSEALSKLPVPQIYAFMFFLMAALVVLNSELFAVETIVCSICDQFPERLRRNHRHVLAFVVLAFFTLGLPLCSAAGIYWIILLENFTATWPLIIIGFFEIMVVCWIYGVDNFLDNIKWMIGYYPPVYLFWKILWKFISPFLLLSLLSLAWIEYRPLHYNSFQFPLWATILGWTLSLSPVIIIMLTFFVQFVRNKGPFTKRIWDLLCPTDDWGPALAVHRAELYPMQIPEARKLVVPPGSRIYKNVGNGSSMDQFMDRYNRPIGRGVYPQQHFDRIISKKASLPTEEKETII